MVKYYTRCRQAMCALYKPSTPSGKVGNNLHTPVRVCQSAVGRPCYTGGRGLGSMRMAAWSLFLDPITARGLAARPSRKSFGFQLPARLSKSLPRNLFTAFVHPRAVEFDHRGRQSQGWSPRRSLLPPAIAWRPATAAILALSTPFRPISQRTHRFAASCLSQLRLSCKAPDADGVF